VRLAKPRLDTPRSSPVLLHMPTRHLVQKTREDSVEAMSA
jgi:hypothetical protein